MLNKKRAYGLGIWGFGLGYYLFYTPYAGLTKALSNGLLPGMRRQVPGAVLLPVSVIATMVCLLGFITAMKWWKYAGRREFFGIKIPFPRRLTFLSAICMATIMGTTTLAFAFGGISIVLVLVLLRGGVLIIAPLVDSIHRRRVRWFSWAAMWISFMAVLLVLADAANYKLTFAAILDVGAYLTAYFFKFHFMTRLAKSGERDETLRYFVEEQMIASPLLLATLGVMAAMGFGDVMNGFRIGFTTFLSSKAAPIALLIGVFYAALCICTTFIFLDRRENTFCVPMHCGCSMLSGFTATYALSFFFNQPQPSLPQLASISLLVVALGFLSPLHHFDRLLARLKHAFAPGQPESVIVTGYGLPTPSANLTQLPLSRLILFVCSGNTCRSPMAAAIAKTEIATRLQIPFENVSSAHVKAISAGVTAKVGEPMTDEAKEALRQLGFHPNGHRARSVNAELAQQAEKIFCMTQAHRQAVVDLIPTAAAKTECFDPDGDVDDPVGADLGVYVNCARRLQSLVRLRFDELGLGGHLQA